MRYPFLLAAVLATVCLAACDRNKGTNSDSDEALATSESAATTQQFCPAPDDSGSIRIAEGLTATVIRNGSGRAAVNGDYADTNVKLWLYDETAENRQGQFIWESGANVFQFQLGRGQVIKGWDLGIPCMLEGEERELVVAGDLAYGPDGRGEIPPNATLLFNIELVKLTAPE